MAKRDILYGVHPVLETLRANRRRCHEVVLAEGRRAKEAEEVRRAARERGVSVREAPRDAIGQRCEGAHHQGVLAVVEGYPYAGLDELLALARRARGGFLLMLDGITDPHNIGSLIRTASLTGVQGVLLPADNAAGITPAVVKASAGATEHMRVVRVPNLVRTIERLKEEGFWISGAAGESAEIIYQHDFKGENILLVLGAEGDGLKRLVRERCDRLLALPMLGPIESYNVSVAGALMMGEIARQRWLESYAKDVPKNP